MQDVLRAIPFLGFILFWIGLPLFVLLDSYALIKTLPEDSRKMTHKWTMEPFRRFYITLFVPPVGILLHWLTRRRLTRLPTPNGQWADFLRAAQQSNPKVMFRWQEVVYTSDDGPSVWLADVLFSDLGIVLVPFAQVPEAKRPWVIVLFYGIIGGLVYAGFEALTVESAKRAYLRHVAKYKNLPLTEVLRSAGLVTYLPLDVEVILADELQPFTYADGACKTCADSKSFILRPFELSGGIPRKEIDEWLAGVRQARLITKPENAIRDGERAAAPDGDRFLKDSPRTTGDSAVALGIRPPANRTLKKAPVSHGAILAVIIAFIIDVVSLLYLLDHWESVSSRHVFPFLISTAFFLLGLATGVLAIRNLRLSRARCPICDARQAGTPDDATQPGKVFRQRLECASCGAIWVTRAPKWIGILLAAVGLFSGLWALALLVEKDQGSIEETIFLFVVALLFIIFALGILAGKPKVIRAGTSSDGRFEHSEMESGRPCA